MARLLSSNALLKAISTLPAARSCRNVIAPFYQNGLKYSTVPSDPDTHEDFKPKNKVQDSAAVSFKDVVEQDVKENPVMIYMKGVPDFPQCGFSSLAVRVLKHYNIPLSARNILEDPELKNAVKAFSHWPTFPQIFIKGEFIGGSDIILNMHQVFVLDNVFNIWSDMDTTYKNMIFQNGELKEKLKDISGSPKPE